jgi:hypothetical protein
MGSGDGFADRIIPGGLRSTVFCFFHFTLNLYFSHFINALYY